jgi:hypothetical protein
MKTDCPVRRVSVIHTVHKPEPAIIESADDSLESPSGQSPAPPVQIIAQRLGKFAFLRLNNHIDRTLIAYVYRITPSSDRIT